MMARSILSNWTALLVSGATSILLTPLLVHTLGDLNYGLCILAASLVDYLGFLDVGIRTSLQRFVARHNSVHDRGALNEAFSTGLVLSTVVACIILSMSLAIAFASPHMLRLDDTVAPVFQQLVLLFGASVTLSVIGLFLGAYLCGLERFDLYNLGGIVSTLLRALVIILALHLGAGIVWIALGTLIGCVVLCTLQWHFVTRVDPNLHCTVRFATIARTRKLLSFGWYVFLITLSDYIRTNSSTLIIANTLGVPLILPFNIALRLVECLRSIVLGLTGPMMPRMSSLHGQGLREDLRTFYLQAVCLTGFFASFAAWMMILNGDELIHRWLGPGFELTYKLTVVLVVGAAVSQIQSPGGPLLIACARHRVLAFWSMAETITTVALSIYWVREYGLVGMALGIAVPRLLIKTTIVPFYVMHVLTLPLRRYVTDGLLRPLAVNAMFLPIYLLTNAFAPSVGVDTLVFNLIWQTLAFVTLVYVVGLTSSSRQIACSRALQLGARTASFVGLSSSFVPTLPSTTRSPLSSETSRTPSEHP